MSNDPEVRSLTLLYQRHRNELLAFLTRRVRCRETARDLLQDAFVRLLHSEHGQVGNLRAFLYRIANNQSPEPLRRRCPACTRYERIVMTDSPDLPPADDTARQALDWFTRLRADDLAAAEQAAFRDWQQDPRNARAYAEVEQLWQSLELPARRVRKRTSRTRWARHAVAASLFLLAAGWLLQPAWQSLNHDYVTAAGERREVLLDDGSTLRLDSASVVDADIHGATRTVHLRQGRLFADVVHDGRPFVVLVDDARIEVLGTRFAVSRDESGDQVLLLSGSVQVTTPAAGARAACGHPRRAVGRAAGGRRRTPAGLARRPAARA